MAVVGYARVSSLDKASTCSSRSWKGDKVFKEKRSGVDSGRPALKAGLEFLRRVTPCS
jgi:hypothetical protein